MIEDIHQRLLSLASVKELGCAKRLTSLKDSVRKFINSRAHSLNLEVPLATPPQKKPHISTMYESEPHLLQPGVLTLSEDHKKKKRDIKLSRRHNTELHIELSGDSPDSESTTLTSRPSDSQLAAPLLDEDAVMIDTCARPSEPSLCVTTSMEEHFSDGESSIFEHIKALMIKERETICLPKLCPRFKIKSPGSYFAL